MKRQRAAENKPTNVDEGTDNKEEEDLDAKNSEVVQLQNGEEKSKQRRKSSKAEKSETNNSSTRPELLKQLKLQMCGCIESHWKPEWKMELSKIINGVNLTQTMSSFVIHFSPPRSKLYVAATINSGLSYASWQINRNHFYHYFQNNCLDDLVYENSREYLGLNKLPINLWYTIIQAVYKHFVPNFIVGSDSRLPEDAPTISVASIENMCHVPPQHFHPDIFFEYPELPSGQWFNYIDAELRIGGKFDFKILKTHWFRTIIQEQLRCIGGLLFSGDNLKKRQEKEQMAGYFKDFSRASGVSKTLPRSGDQSLWGGFDYGNFHFNEQTYNSLFLESRSSGEQLGRNMLSHTFTFNEFLLLLEWKFYLIESNAKLFDAAFNDPTFPSAVDDFSQSLASPVGRLRNEKFATLTTEYPRILEQLTTTLTTCEFVNMPTALTSLIKEYVTIDPPQ